MASFKQYTASGGTSENFSIATFTTSEIHVYVDGVLKTKGVGTTAGLSHDYEIQSYTTNGGTIAWVSGKAPSSGTVRIVRITDIMNNADTEVEALATYSAGSSIKSDDLNDNQTQVLRALEEEQDQLIQGYDIEPGAINSAHIKDGTILDADISPTAEIQVSKLKDGTARQVLQTAANGTDVEWTSNVDLPGTLDVTGASTLDGTLAVTGESTLASATVSDLTSGRIVFTSTGGALVDSADLTFDTTGDGHLKVGVDGGYGTITCATINATYWNGENEDAFWKVNRNAIDHYGKDTGSGSSYKPAISIRKDSGNLSSGHRFAIAKDYTFEVGRYVNEGLAGGTWNTLHYAPVFRAKQDIEQDRITNTSSNNPGQSTSDYSVFRGSAGCEDEHGQIWIGDGSEGYGYNLTGTTINLGGFTSFDARRNGIWTSNNNPTNPDGYQPVLMLSGQKGAMFVHPDNTSHIDSSSNTTSGLRYLAYGAGGHGIESLGDSYNYGGDGYRDPDECIDLLEAAADLQIIVGGARVKNKFEIGSGSVTGTLAISGTNVTATAAELNVLDGVTATTAELNLLDGVTATTSELNIVDGVTATTAELNNLDGYTGTTSELNILDGVTATTAELNIVDGMTKATSLTSNSDTEYPTSKAVADHVTAAIAPLGGLEVIATDAVFPNTQPDSGVVISISDAGGVAFNGSGVSTTATTVGGSTVTINGAPSSLYSETLVAGVGLMVSSTGSSQTYNYHKILGKEDDIKQLSDDINDFNARYRIASSAPSSNNDDGDLYYDTTLKKMKVYNAVTSQWDDVAQSSTSYIVTLSEAFDNSRTSFTMSTAATDAQSTIVSINGVIQKPNAGTSQPSEGFAINGNQLVLAAAPPTNSTYFVVVLGDTVSIGTPSDNTVTSAKIVDGSIVNGDISSSAAIEASKLDNPLQFPDSHKVSFGTGGTGDFEIYSDGTDSYISHTTGDLYLYGVGTSDDIYVWSKDDIYLSPQDGENGIKVVGNDSVKLYYDGSTDPKLETTSLGTKITGDLWLDNPDTAGEDIQFDSSESKLKFDDNVYANFGSGDDLQIYHNGTHSLIRDMGTGNLKITGSQIDITNAGNTAFIAQFIANGAVTLWYDGTKKFETNSDGVEVTGILDFDSSVSGGAIKLQDDQKLFSGSGQDLQIYHDGTNSYIYNQTNDLKYKAAAQQFIGSNDENMIIANQNGSVTLYHDNLNRLETQTWGVTVGPNATGDTWVQVGRSDFTKQCGLIINDSSNHNDARSWYIYQRPSNSALEFYTTGANARRMSINDTGYLKAGNTVGWTDAGSSHELTSTNSNWTFQLTNSHGSAPYGMQVYFSGCDPNNTTYKAYQFWGGSHSSPRWLVWANGDSQNTNGTFSQLSDIKLKQDIVDASSQWDDIKNLKIKKYRFKDNPSGELQIGVIAQDVEQTSPGLVYEFEDEDVEGNKSGTKTKCVKQSILYMKAVKALQEAMAKIETLETKVAALEAK